ncbi:hypothetical protein BKA64DRAFT_636736 [Cadophora sp. MPI-SDFR-AT-0126]|nr:hypothetical protein BKA64DRAFT_636736 [Leotiomycetes sp. MPI-SDFR-AT-0126]
MASSMGPPQPAGYSLRVQLFGPTAYDANDKPIRCFRVVASPEYTVEEFCAEASRIHQINYGTPLTLKKVQDDQQFDITQSEILGNLFATASTIRFVQASSIPGREDSVAPNSALRFDPTVSRKRDREGSARVNGSTTANAWRPNKRQRVADPDEPLPSRENGDRARETSRPANGRISEANMIPNSQESIVLGNNNEPFHNSRHVRKSRSSIFKAVREIAETPPPSPPPPVLLRSPFDEYGSADQQMNQHELDEDSNIQSQRHHSSPLGEATARAQSQGSNPRSKSASYHIQRATERGTSVSTAATSPLSVDQRLTQNGAAFASQRRRPESRPAEREPNGKPGLSYDESSIYENIASDDEEFGLASIAKGRKASLKARNSPSGLPGLEWSKTKFNTPPSGSRRSSASKEQITPGELPLTPNSKEREARQKQKQRQEAEEARRTRLAAAEARQAEETLKAEAKRAELEEHERIQVEDFKRGEAERKAAIAKSARLEKEREERGKREAEEERLREEARIAKEKAEEEKRAEEERLAQEKAVADEAERLRKEKQEAAAAALKQKKKTPTPEEFCHTKSTSPILPRPSGRTPSSSSQIQSTTPFIPGQRKSALKRPASSQAMRSSSPAGSKASTDDSTGVGIEIQMPFPKNHNRRVSFRDEPEDNVTPIKPQSRILPPKAGTPKSTPNLSTPKPSPNDATPSSSTPKPSGLATKAASAPDTAPRASQGTILPPPRSTRPILPPGRSAGRSSLGRTITPVQSKISPAPKEPTPEVTKKISPVPAPAGRQSITPVPAPKEVTSAKSELKQPVDVEISSDDSEEDIPSRSTPKKQPLGLHYPESSKVAVIPATEEDSSDDEEVEPAKEVDADETQSHNSSPRDSRSPVIFSQHPRSTNSVKARNYEPPETDSGSESEADDDEDDEDQDDEDSDLEDELTSMPRNELVDDEAEEGTSSSGSEDSKDDEEENEDEDEEVEVPNSSPPVLPPHKHQASPKPAGINSSKESLSDEGHNTQDEIDQQLTSSLYEAHSTIPASSAIVYPPSSSAAPRPAMKIGVSLSSLSKSKSMLATSSAIKPVVGRSGQRTLQNMEDEDSEESEESDDESSDGSEFEEPKSTQKAKSPARRDASSDSDSSGDSDSDSEGEDARRKIRDELALQIAGVKGNENLNLLSPKVYKTSTQQQDTGKERKKKAEKKTDKYVSGYHFNTSF